MIGRIEFEALSYKSIMDIHWIGSAKSAAQAPQFWSVKLEVTEKDEADPDGFIVTELMLTPDQRMTISGLIPYVIDAIESEEFEATRVDVSAQIQKRKRA